MAQKYSAAELTRKLLAFDTVNPPGNERPCAEFISGILRDTGFEVRPFEFDQRRTSLVADLRFSDDREPICFSGHLDTVPLGRAAWSKDPFSGQQEGDRIYGRGAADMKGGLAAMILAAVNIAGSSTGAGGLKLVLTAGEENGCQGATHLAGLESVLGRAGALVVGEPTGNYPVIGHKGAFWLEAVTTGVTAHGSMPEQGVNAIYRAARAIAKLETFDFGIEPHPVLGAPTLNVGTISGGININSVPDRTTFALDLRLVAGQSIDQVHQQLQTLLGDEVELIRLTAAPAIYTDPDDGWVQEVFSIMEIYLGERPVPRAAAYFTDASALTAAFGGAPTVILGPGQPEMAHKTDEYCCLSRIESAVRVYEEIARRWCRIEPDGLRTAAE
jgi:succinyl-diaminopimelate desuccinylase